jgi:hypothetical protein
MCDRVVLTRGKFNIPAAETRRSEAATVTQSARGYSELWQHVRIQVASALASRVCLSWVKGLERGLPVKKGRQLVRRPSGSDLRYLEQTL